MTTGLPIFEAHVTPASRRPSTPRRWHFRRTAVRLRAALRGGGLLDVVRWSVVLALLLAGYFGAEAANALILPRIGRGSPANPVTGAHGVQLHVTTTTATAPPAGS